jgi:hypothetical protein
MDATLARENQKSVKLSDNGLSQDRRNEEKLFEWNSERHSLPRRLPSVSQRVSVFHKWIVHVNQIGGNLPGFQFRVACPRLCVRVSGN